MFWKYIANFSNVDLQDMLDCMKFFEDLLSLRRVPSNPSMQSWKFTTKFKI